jgi:hypothetical protein
MKPLLPIGVAFLWLSAVLQAQEPAAATPKSVQFDGQTFMLASDQPTKTGSIEEFLLPGQAFTSWTKLAAIHHFPLDVDPALSTAELAQTVHQNNPQAQTLVMNNSATGDSLIDFVTWPTSDPNGIAYIEFDVFKYQKLRAGGLVAYQYALRAYGKDGAAFLKTLKTERVRLDNLMATGGLTPAP